MLKKVAFTMFPVKDTKRARTFHEITLGLSVGSHSDNGVWTEGKTIILHKLKKGA